MLKRIESIWIPDDVKKLWFISFELFKIAGVGGMGNVVLSQQGTGDQRIRRNCNHAIAR